MTGIQSVATGTTVTIRPIAVIRTELDKQKLRGAQMIAAEITGFGGRYSGCWGSPNGQQLRARLLVAASF
jgi:hypothetical protein